MTQVQNQEGLRRSVILSLPSEDILGIVRAELLKTQKNFRMDGFRRGKVPMRIVSDMFAHDITSRVTNERFQEEFLKVAKEENIPFYGILGVAGLDESERESRSDESLVYAKVVFEEPAALEKKGELSDVSFTRYCVTEKNREEMIAKTILKLRKEHSKFEPTDGPIGPGDTVALELDIECEKLPGGKQHYDRYRYESEPGEFFGLQEKLLGASKGQTVVIGDKIDLNAFSFEFHDAPDWADAKLTAVVKEIFRCELRELDPEFLKQIGVEDGAADTFRNEIAKNVNREIDRRLAYFNHQNMYSAVFAKAMNPLLPEVFLRQGFADWMAQRYRLEKGVYGVNSFEEYMKRLDGERQLQAFAAMACQRLFDEKMAESLKIEATDADVDAYIEQSAELYDNAEDFAKKAKADKDTRAAVRDFLQRRKVCDAVTGQMKVTEKNVTVQALYQQPMIFDHEAGLFDNLPD